MGLINFVKTLFYGFMMRIKLSWYTRKKRKKKKFMEKVLLEKLGDTRIEEKTIEKVIENYLEVGEIFLDRKNLKAAFGFFRINLREK